MITSRQKRLDERQSWEVYVAGRPVAYNLTKGEQKRLKRQLQRRMRRYSDSS